MAKLPMEIARNAGVLPNAAPGTSVNLGVTGQTAQDFSKVSSAWNKAASDWTAVREKLAQSRNAVKLAELSNELDTIGEQRIANPDDNVQPEEYRKTVTNELQKVVEQRIQGADAQFITAARARSTVQIGDIGIRAQRTATKKLTETIQASAIEQVDNLSKKGTTDARQEGMDLIAGLTSAGVFTAEASRTLRERIHKGSLANAFGKAVDLDPNEALRQVNMRQGIFGLADDEEHRKMVVSAKTAIEHQESVERARRADREHAERKAAEIIKQESETARSQATVEAMSGTYSVERLDSDARIYRWSPEHYQHLRELVTNPKATRSDQEIFQQAMLRARSTSVSQRDREWFAQQYRMGRINALDYAKVDNEAQTNIRSVVDESKSNLSRIHGQAEQELRAALGITGLLETLTQDQKKAYSSALQELTERSAFLRGTEDPLAVVRDIAPRYQAVITDSAAMTVEQKTKLLRYKTPQELEAAFKAGQITEASYRIERQRFIEIGGYVPSFIKENMVERKEKSKAKPELQREKK